MLDIIIPVLNEEHILREYQTYYASLGQRARLIFVDGGSVDKTIQEARRFGVVISSKRGRGVQKNMGAAQATSDPMLFLNVDAFLTDDALQAAKSMMQGKDAGCFQLKILDNRWVFRVFEWLVNWRARHVQMVDGDLGLFVSRKLFKELGGFAEIPIMEDIEFSVRLKKRTRINVINQPITVLSRKWSSQGFFRTLAAYTRAYFRFWTGMLARSA